MTHTARASQRSFWLYVALTALSLTATVLDDDRDWSTWLHVVLTLVRGTMAVRFLRSWRILSRQGGERSG